MIVLNLLIIIDIACTFAVIWFVLFMLLMYLYGEGLVSCTNLFPIQLYGEGLVSCTNLFPIQLYGEGLVSCKNLFPIQLYIYIDNKIIIKYKVKENKHTNFSRLIFYLFWQYECVCLYV